MHSDFRKKFMHKRVQTYQIKTIFFEIELCMLHFFNEMRYVYIKFIFYAVNNKNTSKIQMLPLYFQMFKKYSLNNFI